MCIIVTEEDLFKKHAKKGTFFVHFLFYPTNVVQTLNIIFALTIVTHAQSFGYKKNMGVKGPKQRPSLHSKHRQTSLPCLFGWL